MVVGGHQRLKVLKYVGYREVDFVFVDLSDENEKAIAALLGGCLLLFRLRP